MLTNSSDEPQNGHVLAVTACGAGFIVGAAMGQSRPMRKALRTTNSKPVEPSQPWLDLAEK